MVVDIDDHGIFSLEISSQSLVDAFYHRADGIRFVIRRDSNDDFCLPNAIGIVKYSIHASPPITTGFPSEAVERLGFRMVEAEYFIQARQLKDGRDIPFHLT